MADKNIPFKSLPLHLVLAKFRLGQPKILTLWTQLNIPLIVFSYFPVEGPVETAPLHHSMQ